MNILVQRLHEKVLAQHFWFVLLLLMSFIVAVFLRREVLFYVCWWVDGTSDGIVQTLLVHCQAWSTGCQSFDMGVANDCNKE